MGGRQPPSYEPEPEEIRRECEKIREGWDEHEHRRRASLSNAEWELPAVTTHFPPASPDSM